MLRLSLFCLLVGAAFVASVDLSKLEVTPRMPYTQNLVLVQQAGNRLKENLVTKQPDVRDAKFHYLLVVATVDKLGKRLTLDPKEPASKLLQRTLNEDLPKLYRDLVLASSELKLNANKVGAALLPLKALKEKLCKNLDEKDCDKLLELKVKEQENSNLPLKRAVNVLRATAKVGQTYLDLHEELLLQGKQRQSFGYLLDSANTLAKLGMEHSHVLKTLR